MNPDQQRHATLPLNRDIPLIYACSLVIALLVAAATLAGLFFREAVYPTDELVRSFVPTDAATIFIGLPFLLGAMWLTRRGRLIGLLSWPGALLFVLYNYLVYLLAMPLNVAFLLHLALVTLSVYALVALIASIDPAQVRAQLIGAVPERLSGGVLSVLGLLFILRAATEMVGAFRTGAPVAETELALLATDFLVSPAWVLVGALLWRRHELGYVTGLGLLFQASMLFIGLIIFMALQPILTGAPFAPVDLVVVFVMGLVCFVPFTLFLRGVVSRRD